MTLLRSTYVVCVSEGKTHQSPRWYLPQCEARLNLKITFLLPQVSVCLQLFLSVYI